MSVLDELAFASQHIYWLWESGALRGFTTLGAARSYKTQALSRGGNFEATVASSPDFGCKFSQPGISARLVSNPRPRQLFPPNVFGAGIAKPGNGLHALFEYGIPTPMDSFL